MTKTAKNLLVCNCNKSMPLDGKALGTALETDHPITLHQQLCRHQIGSFQAALKEADDLVVACTQEAPLFSELHAESNSISRISFVNIRESAGWSKDAKGVMPKIAALLSAAALPDPEPVGTASYTSSGRLLIVGEARSATAWGERLCEQLDVAVLVTGGGIAPSVPLERRYPVYSGKISSLTGYLGAFEAHWDQVNPIDLELCTRCNACIKACPEQAIDFSYQIDLNKCRAHRECVKACGEVRAIDFDRTDRARGDQFDLVLNLTSARLFGMPDPPQGYFAPGPDPIEQAIAVTTLVHLVGEFEKPKFFVYKDRLCAHGRSQITGCNLCIDVCSTGAISSDGDHVKVEPHLCMGCGGCTTVCPSGAMTYGYQRVSDRGLHIKTLLQTYRKAAGRDACLLFHNPDEGRRLIARLAREGSGLPARTIPVETFHIAAVGIDLLLGAFALGACQVTVLATGREPLAYRDALRSQMGFAEEILTGLGFRGTHFALIEAADASALEMALWSLESAQGIAPATFNLSNEKRTTLDFVFDHLLKHAPVPKEVVALSKGAPYGRVIVNRDSCTLCMSCVGACPENALADSKEFPRLNFIERNCVQCGLCEKTCPESAITLETRLLLGREAKTPVTLNEAEPFHCIACGKPFATRQMIDNMTSRLSGHSMFSEGNALNRIKMCADCRVVDMYREEKQMTIFDV